MSLLIVFKKLWRWLQSLWRRWQKKPVLASVASELPVWSDAKYESFFFELLKGVCEQEWERDEVLAYLAKREGDGRLIVWLKRFGANRLQDAKLHKELAEQMAKLGDMDGGEFFQEVKRIAGELLAKPEITVAVAKKSVQITQDKQVDTQIEKKEIASFLTFDVSLLSDEIQELILLCNQECEQGNLESGIAYLRQAIDKEANVAFLWCRLGELLDEVKKREEAIASYDRALSINPDSHEAWFLRGNALFSLRRHEEAIISYERNLAINPDLQGSWFIRGINLFELGRYEEALTSYDQALSIDSFFPEALYYRGKALFKLGRYEEALTSYDQALSIDSFFLKEMYDDKGDTLSKLGRYEEALTSYDKALSIKPSIYTAWYGRGNTLGKSERYEESIVSYDQALSIKPNFYEAWYGRGISLAKLKRYEESIVSCDQALSIKSDFYRAWYNRSAAAMNSLQSESNIALFLPKGLAQRAKGSIGRERALVSCDAGISYCDSQSPEHIEGRGKLHQKKGDIYFERSKGARDYRTQYANAISSYEAALNEWKEEYKYQFGEEYLEILLSLIRIYTALGNTELAQTLRREGTELYQRLLETSDERGKEKLTRRFVSSFRDLTISAYVQTGQLIEALEAAETDKNQCLAWMFADNEIPIASYGSMQELLDPKTAIIFWHISDYALTTFLLLPNATAPLGFSAFPVNGEPEFETWQRQWQTDHQTEVIEDSTANFPQWITGMTSRCDQLRQLLNIDTIQTELDKYPEINQLLLVPHRTLHLYPLHSLFDSKYLITHVPSLQIAIELKQRQQPQPTTNRQLLAIANPKHQIKTTDVTDELEITKKVKNLRFAEAEGKAICQAIANSQLLTGETATLERLSQELSDHPTQILHFSCHGKHDPEKPENSQLYLSQNDTLTFKQIPSLPLTTCQLAYLSACETGMTANKTIRNEYIGLSSAFLYAGVPVIVSTLWSIEDVASALLSIAFYDRYLHPNTGGNAPLALKQAQAWLRDFDHQEYERIYADSQWQQRLSASQRAEVQTALNRAEKPYDSPYYWAGYYTVCFFKNIGNESTFR